MLRVVLIIVWVVSAVAASSAGLDYYLTPLQERPFTEGHALFASSAWVGHGYGVLGSGSMVFGVLMYGIRKRVPALGKLGKLKHWLQVHIFLCTLGPFLILLHSTFRVGGLVSIASWSMVLVVGSGFFGRYLYVHIPKTLQGTFLSMEAIESRRVEARSLPHTLLLGFRRDFSLIRMDTDTFPHLATGYTLKGAHTEVGCRACHTPELVSDPQLRQELSATGGLAHSHLGLNPQCKSCHETDGPHQSQFAGRDCSGCHAEVEWEGALVFDHAQASFLLDGQHSEVVCTGCHVAKQLGGKVASIRYAPVEASDCSSCHEDPHKNQMSGSCNGCHATNGWHRVNRSTVESTFDHGATGFALMGAHSRAECQSCHSTTPGTNEQLLLHFSGRPGGRSYPIPEHENCISCHLDSHEGDFGDRSCDLCHGPDSWIPPDYDRAQNQMEFRFAHGLLDEAEWVGSCRTCHTKDGPHRTQFGNRDCRECHGTDAYAIPDFDHMNKRFPLEGAHTNVSCGECHLEIEGPAGKSMIRYRPLDPACTACHGGAA